MRLSLLPSMSLNECEQRSIGAKEVVQDSVRDGMQFVSISGLSSDLNSKTVSTCDGLGSALEALEGADYLHSTRPCGLSMQLWSTADSAALAATPSHAPTTPAAATSETCTWTNVNGQATTVPATASGQAWPTPSQVCAPPSQPFVMLTPTDNAAATLNVTPTAPTDAAQPMTWLLPTAPGGVTPYMAVPSFRALGVSQNNAFVPLTSSHVDCNAMAPGTVWQSVTATPSSRELQGWLPYAAAGNGVVQLSQPCAMPSTTNLQTVHDPSVVLQPSDKSGGYVLLLPTATTAASTPYIQHPQQTGWTAVAPGLMPAGTFTMTNASLPPVTSTPAAAEAVPRRSPGAQDTASGRSSLTAHSLDNARTPLTAPLPCAPTAPPQPAVEPGTTFMPVFVQPPTIGVAPTPQQTMPRKPIVMPLPPWQRPQQSTASPQTTSHTVVHPQTTPHVKAWMSVNDQWRPLVLGL